MYGNPLGWLISAGLAALSSYLIFLLAGAPSTTAPSNAAALAVAKKEISLPVRPEMVCALGTKDGDAGPLYRKAIVDFDHSERIIAKFNDDRMSVKANQLPFIDALMKARDCKTCKLFVTSPGDVVNYDNVHPMIESLLSAGRLCVTVGMVEATPAMNKASDATRRFEAAFILGMRLYEERLAWDEMVKAHDLMQTAASQLKKIYTGKADSNSQTHLAAIDSFMSEEFNLESKLVEAQKIIGSTEESYAAPYAGDIFEIAQSDQADPMFRVEAIKHIGNYRYNCKSYGDQKKADRVLAKLDQQANLPLGVKEAVKRAIALTKDEHNKIGGAS